MMNFNKELEQFILLTVLNTKVYLGKVRKKNQILINTHCNFVTDNVRKPSLSIELDKIFAHSDKVVDEASQFDQFTVDLNPYSPRDVENPRTPLSPLNDPN